MTYHKIVMIGISRSVKGRLQAHWKESPVFVAFSLLLAAACLVPALGKLTAQPKMLASASHFGIPWPSYRLIGVAELAAVAGVLAGLYWLPMGVVAASGMAVLLVGALTVHRRVRDSLQEAAPAVLGLAVSLAYLAAAVTR
jgi:DoxX-like family